ncbi:MAG: protein translocase subunit SecD, partial [Bacteroidota bacterium]
SFQIIRTRIDKFGVANPNIQKLPGTNRILVELPGVDNPERVRKLLSGVAKLEFWEVWELQEVFPYYQQLAAYLVKEEQKKQLLNKPKGENGADSTGAKEDPLKVEDAGSGLSIDTNEDPLSIDEAPEIKEDANDSLNPETAQEADSSTEIISGDINDPLSIDSDTTVEVKDSVQQAKEDSTAAADSTSQAINAVAQLISPSVNEGVFRVKVKDTSRVNEIMVRDEVRTLFPSNMKFLWDVKPDEASNTIALFAIKRGRGGKAPLEGDVVVDARSDFDQGKPVVSMQMNATGAKGWKKLTGANVNRRIAIVLDNYVYSAPVVNGEIPNGSSQISGNFTVNEAKDLANILKAGKLPAPTRIVEEATVGPSLGQESISQGLTSILIGLSLVVVFMILYYRSSGFVANLALLVNIFFILGILAQLGAVLTLAGMAGIVLTIGMSVDANVLIYERIREELRNNKGIKAAVKLGYEKAYSSIIDANATTFLTGVILYSFGSGGVKGFAVTLMIGILCSLFSAIFITRLIIEAFINRKNNKFISFDSILFKESFQNFNINFVGLRRKAYIFSGVIISIGIVLMLVQGLTLGVDFKGG